MITLVCQPESKEGFVIQVAPSANNSCVIKGCKLPQDSEADFRHLTALLADVEKGPALQEQEFQIVRCRISEINITPHEASKCCENMVHYTMWIKKSNNDVLLKWISEPPTEWKGISALVSTLLGLLNKYLPKLTK